MRYLRYRIGCVLMLMVLSVTLLFGCGAEKKESGSALTPGSSILAAPKKNASELPSAGKDKPTLTGVFSYIDQKSLSMHFYDIASATEYEVFYNAGTDIQTRYGSVSSVSKMKLGEIYDVYCSSKGVAEKIYGSKSAWERTSLYSLDFNENNRRITIGETVLGYDKNALIFSKGERISIAKIIKQDEVTLRGIDNTVYSIAVEAGHGYLKLTGVDAFLGGYIMIGKRQLLSVTDGMIITVTEGKQDVELQCGSLIAKKTVTIENDKEATLDFSEFTPPATRMGAVNFIVTPDNAIMTIDGKEVDYKQPIQLSYGTHRVSLSASKYETYTETMVVNSTYTSKIIDMSAKSGSAGGSTSTDQTSGYKVSVSEPAGAALYVDSVYIGIVPCSFEKKYGTRTITLTQSGYNTVSYSIAIANATGDLKYAFPAMEKSSSSNSSSSGTSSSSSGSSSSSSNTTATKAENIREENIKEEATKK